MIAARQIAFGGGKRGLSAKDIPVMPDVAYWDGIENAGWGMHNANAAIWKDLIGDFDLTVNSNAFFLEDGLYSDNNTTVKKGMAYRDETIPQDKVKTIEICARVDAFNKNAPHNAWVFLLNDDLDIKSTNLCVVVRNSSGEGIMRTGISSSPVNRDFLPHYYVVTEDVGFLDGKELSSREYMNSYLNPGCFCLFGRNGSTDYQPDAGIIYSCAIHSHVLTAKEVAANCEFYRQRFNLL